MTSIASRIGSFLVVAAAGPDRLGLRLQHHPDAGGAGQGEVGRRAEQLPAPRRPDPEPRRHRAGLRQAGEGRADRGGRGARQGDADHRSTPRQPHRPREAQAVPGRAEPALAARSAGCSRSARTIPTSSRTRTSWRCSRSSKAPRTASRSRGATTSRRCAPTTPSCGPSPACCGR